jgi:hypothetical protein
MSKKSAKRSEGRGQPNRVARSNHGLHELMVRDESDDDLSKDLLDPSKRLQRDSSGRIPPKPKSLIRDAVLEELGRRHITRYQLWQLAHQHCAGLSQSAVYEFLRGQRQLGLEYVEALLSALNLSIITVGANSSIERARSSPSRSGIRVAHSGSRVNRPKMKSGS